MIKDKMKAITGGDISEPVYLKNVSVLDSECSPGGTPVYMTLNSIFCDDDGVLCGDLVGELQSFTDGIIFGQSIEYLQMEDLENILDILSDDSWSVIINNERVGKFSSFLSLSKKNSRYARGA